MKTKAEHESNLLSMLAEGPKYLCAYTQLSLWLAAHRLMQAGKVKESQVSNVFQLA